MNCFVTAERTVEVLNWLNELENEYSLKLDKIHKRLAEDANKIISSQLAKPQEPEEIDTNDPRM